MLRPPGEPEIPKSIKSLQTAPDADLAALAGLGFGIGYANTMLSEALSGEQQTSDQGCERARRLHNDLSERLVERLRNNLQATPGGKSP
jgi:hypothetical protein